MTQISPTPISQEDSKRITALRFLLIVFVVFIHNCFTDESVAKTFAETGEVIVFNQSTFGKWIQLFISQGIARCAVPLFFLFAAFLQAKKSAPYSVLLKKRAKSLLLPYILWFTLYFLYPHFAKFLILQIKPTLLKHPDDIFLNWTFSDWIHKILGYKIEADEYFSHPELAAQFWFVRDLMILIVLSPILQFLIKKYKAGFFALICLLYLVPVNVYFVRMQALFFYTAGLYWGFFNLPLFEKIDSIKWSEIIALFLISFFATYLFFDGNQGTMYWIMVIFACVLVLKCSRLIIKKEKLFSLASYLAGFSFFLYAVHMPVLNGTFVNIWLKLFPMTNGFFCLFEYFGVNILTILIGTAFGIVLKKLCSPIFALLTGGR